MLILTVFISGIYLDVILTFIKVFGYAHMIRKYVLAVFMWPTGLLIETFIYWLIRKRIHRKSWVWAHISCVVASLVCLMGSAILFSSLSGYIADDMSPTQYARLRSWFFQIRFGMIWGF